MSNNRHTETTFELTTIERLEQLGYTHHLARELYRPVEYVILTDRLRDFLHRQYPHLPDDALNEIVEQASCPDGIDTLRRNMAFHQSLVRGIEHKVQYADGRAEYQHIYLIDWDNADNNHFEVINQLPIRGKNDRRPDIIIFINGLPLVVFELKNPYTEQPTAEEAYNQIQHYRHDISQLFDFNALTIVSDGITTLHGMWTAAWEWFAPWKSINGSEIEPTTTGTMKTLIEGLFPKTRLLDYIRHFILFEKRHDQITKKGAKYHQFFAVRLAAKKAIAAYRTQADKRIGVVWHTTGAGKSLSMVFLIALLRRASALENPSFVVQVDRNDLDNQLYDQFVAARALVGNVKHADNVYQLRNMLQTEGGEVIFSTIEKFRLKKEQGEIEHPILSTRRNIIIIADEAHRSQYGFAEGYARYLNEALPNAHRLGFTGTPVSLSGADTVAVFGDIIHTYDIKQSQDDKATVPIFYEPRQIKLHLSDKNIDADFAEITEDENTEQTERYKQNWATLAAAAGAKERITLLAHDLLNHFLERCRTLEGKAMIVCMTRDNCVRLYDALTALPFCPKIKVVMTSNLSKDPPVWSQAGHSTTKKQREAIKACMIDPDDPLKMVIVCDMWLTGTDIPCLHTLYVDKPMHGHNLIQAISRVNRVFRDKPAGLVVDYIGISNQLSEATRQYTRDGGQGKPAPDLKAEALPIFIDSLETARKLLPHNLDYGTWRHLSNLALEDLYAQVYAHLSENEQLRDDFLTAEKKLSSAYLLVKHFDECRGYADEVIFCQRVRKQIRKTIPAKKSQQGIEQAVRDLVDDSIETKGVVDIFQAAGLEKPDISILDDDFLQRFADKPYENLRIKLLAALISDEIQLRQHKNLKKYRSFQKMLQEALKKYHNRTLDTAAVIAIIVEIAQEIRSSDQQRVKELGLTLEELAFYDAVAENLESVYEQPFLCKLIQDIVQTLKRELKPDWTRPHRESIKAKVRLAVKKVLRKHKVKKEDFDFLLGQMMEQAEALYTEWPLAA
jgi:type I restriction enzyme R subunit